jgi:hypothetical protein
MSQFFGVVRLAQKVRLDAVDKSQWGCTAVGSKRCYKWYVIGITQAPWLQRQCPIPVAQQRVNSTSKNVSHVDMESKPCRNSLKLKVQKSTRLVDVVADCVLIMLVIAMKL